MYDGDGAWLVVVVTFCAVVVVLWCVGGGGGGASVEGGGGVWGHWNIAVASSCRFIISILPFTLGTITVHYLYQLYKSSTKKIQLRRDHSWSFTKMKLSF
ncbi:Protein of unknown function [Gryllus bimaculatus]|nr:Protein of unknown function [Gryllus bimaculatus]